MTIGLSRRGFTARLTLIGLLALGLAVPASAAEKDVDGLPLPRFVSTRSAPINVHVGPGEKYDVAWIFNLSGMPVEVTAEFDIWRKIRDFDGSEGWVQENLLSGNRIGLVLPWKKDAQSPLHASANDTSAIRAYLGAGFRVTLRKCDGTWCQVDAATQDGHGPTYSGYLKQSDLWGAYQGETF